jgi:trigger factor
VGDTFTVKAKGPEQHEVEGIRNNDLTMTFQVERIDRIIAAKIEDVVQAFGMQDEKQMRDAIRQRLSINVQIQSQTAMHNQIAKHLIETTKLDLPARITANQAERTLQRRRVELLYRGVEAHKIEEHMAELRAQSNVAAVRELKMFFILFRAAEQLSVQVRENEVNQRIIQMAQQRNMRPEQLVQQLRQSNQLNAVVQQIRDHKTMDTILAKAKVSEMSADEYNKWAKEQKD